MRAHNCKEIVFSSSATVYGMPKTVPIKEVVAVMNIAKRNHYKVIMATSPE